MKETDIFDFPAGPSFKINRQKVTKANDLPASHFHDQYEVCYLMSGSRQYFVKDKSYNISKGDLVLINSLDLHKTSDTAVSEYERILLQFKYDYLSNMSKAYLDILILPFRSGVNVLHLDIQEQSIVENILFKMLQEDQNHLLGYEACINALLVEFLVFTGRLAKIKGIEPAQQQTQLQKKVYDIVQHINMHYREELNLSEVSEQFCFSPYYLCRIFKEVTGFSFVEYINSVRVKEAQRLLRETKWNIVHIACEVGFGSNHHFGRVFKSITGYTPLQYRKAIMP